jgi:long-subunit fatty acid transport protein
MVTPQSVNLDFQTGIAANTLLMASVRWVDWSEFDITPIGYQTATTTSLVAYDDDRIGYTLGVGRKFNDQWSGSATIGYEKTLGGISSNLSPTDGYLSFALGAQYTMDNMKISGGVRYIQIGDADTGIGPGQGNFRDNSGFAVGLKVSYTF